MILYWKITCVKKAEAARLRGQIASYELGQMLANEKRSFESHACMQ